MPRGGARPGAGRKKNPAKELRTAQATAERILAELQYEKEIVSLYRETADHRLKLQILTALQDRAFGKPAFAEPEKTPELNVNLNASDRLNELLARAVQLSKKVSGTRGSD